MAAEAGNVVQQTPGLVLLGIEAGQGTQAEAVMARFGHTGADAQPVTVRRAHQLDLVGVEAEVVEPP